MHHPLSTTFTLETIFDSNGDGVGYLDSIREKLDYFAWLNVDGILLSPISESPSSDLGYDITNLSAINPKYGDMSTFKSLVEEAEARGIAVFLNFVAKHTSSKRTWFLDSASSKIRNQR